MLRSYAKTVLIVLLHLPFYIFVGVGLKENLTKQITRVSGGVVAQIWLQVQLW